MRSFTIPTHYRSALIGRLKAFRKAQDPKKKDLAPTLLDLGAVRFVFARHFGFCYGVENAIEISYQAIDQNPGKRIFLLSDEAYSRIVFDDREYPSPTDSYADSLLLYTYGKTLLTPGQRIGYIALPPTMQDREPLREALFAAQVVAGWAFPNALLQHALPELDKVSIDIGHLQRKRDSMVAALRAMGYELNVPEGTFYLLVRSPDADDMAFSDRLAAEGVFVLPGSVAEVPGTFRISLTASDAMIERSLPGFERAIAGVPT